MAEDSAPVEAENQPDEAAVEEAAKLVDESSDDPWENEAEGTAEPAPEPEAEAETEPEPESEAEPEPEKAPEKTVPYAALHEERQLRKEAAAENADMRDKVSRMEERFSMFQEATAAPVADFDDDPAGHLKAQTEAQTKAITEIQATQRAQAEAQEQQKQFGDFMGHYSTAAAAFSESNPDFGAAYKHLAEQRTAIYKASGLDPRQIESSIQRDEIEVVQNAMQTGRDPAEAIYEVAKAHGYTNEPKPEKTEGEEKIETIAEGQKASTTLAGTGKTTAPISLEQLADMDSDSPEFSKAWSEIFGKTDNIYS